MEVTSSKSLLLLGCLGEKCNMTFQNFLFKILISKSYTKIRESIIKFIKVVIEIEVRDFWAEYSSASHSLS